MKLIKTASGKKQIKISKKEWVSIGKKAGWTRIAGQDQPIEILWNTYGYLFPRLIRGAINSNEMEIEKIDNAIRNVPNLVAQWEDLKKSISNAGVDNGKAMMEKAKAFKEAISSSRQPSSYHFAPPKVEGPPLTINDI